MQRRRCTFEDAIFWLTILPVFAIAGYFGCMSCSRAYGDFPSWYTPHSEWGSRRLVRRGGISVMAPDPKTAAEALAETRGVDGRVAIQIAFMRERSSMVVGYKETATVYVYGPEAEWRANLRKGLEIAKTTPPGRCQVVRFGR